MLCANNNNKTAVKRLIKHKANTEIFSSHNKNALMLASEKGHTDAAVTLIRLGANTEKKPPNTQDIFTLAETNGYKECAEKMKKAVKELVKTAQDCDATNRPKRRKVLYQQEPK